MKELLRTTDPTLVSFVTALLKAEDIECFTMDSHFSALQGSLGILPHRMMVADRHLFRARAILSDNDVELPAP